MLRPSRNSILQKPAVPKAEEQTIKHVHTLRRKAAKREVIHMLNVANAARELQRLPDDGESIHAVMRGNFHGWDLVPATIRLAAPATIKAMSVATLGFNKQNAAELLKLIDNGTIGSVNFICSVYFQKSCPSEFQLLAIGLAERNQRIIAARSHAKVIAMELSDGRKLVIESSANLRSCRNIEQFCMTHDTPTFIAFTPNGSTKWQRRYE